MNTTQHPSAAAESSTRIPLLVHCGHQTQSRPIAAGRADPSDLHDFYCEDCAAPRDVVNDEIEALRDDASDGGDPRTVALCLRAEGYGMDEVQTMWDHDENNPIADELGDIIGMSPAEARAKCVRIIEDTRAMVAS